MLLADGDAVGGAWLPGGGLEQELQDVAAGEHKSRGVPDNGARSRKDETRHPAPVLPAQDSGPGTYWLEAGDLAGMVKGAKAKQVLAWWLRQRTVVQRTRLETMNQQFSF